MTHARAWPEGDLTRVPMWIYSDDALYDRELGRLFYGPEWCYVGLSAEVPAPGDFKTTWVGERSVIVIRDRDGSVEVLENSCAHRGAQLCAEPFEDYLGPNMLAWFDRVFDGRELVVLGDLHQRIPANWKLMFENIKDPYHASVLHVFLVTFGLFRADQPSATEMDDSGRHSVLVCSRKGAAEGEAATLVSYRPGLELHDPALLDVAKEFDGDVTLVMQTLCPNLIVQQQSNTLAVRQIVPRGVGAHDRHWTVFGYEDDTAEMTLRRLRQANLMGPAGYVSLDDGEVLALAQRGITSAPQGHALVAMDGDGIADADHVVTEVAMRKFFRYYRDAMGL